MTEEEWRTHPDHPGIEVSSRGRIRSYLKYGPKGGIQDEPRYLSPSVDPDGYERVSVKCVDGSRKGRGVHQLVAEVYVLGWFEGAKVLHKDDVPNHNSITNLKWGTSADNTKDRHTNKGLGLTRSADDIREMRRLCEMGFTQREVARVFRTTQSYVHMVVTRKQRKDVA